MNPPDETNIDPDEFLDQWRTLIEEQNRIATTSGPVPAPSEPRPAPVNPKQTKHSLNHRPLWQKVVAGAIFVLLLVPTLSFAHAFKYCIFAKRADCPRFGFCVT